MKRRGGCVYRGKKEDCYDCHTYSERCFFDRRFDTDKVHNPGCGDRRPPPTDLSTRWVFSEWLTAWLSGVENLPYSIFSGRPHIFFLINLHDSFPLSLLPTLKHRCHILFWNLQLTWCQRLKCNMIIGKPTRCQSKCKRNKQWKLFRRGFI